ncbi:hypothetical protein [Kamptonema formosum]|uniref:hypothetical protein n=1 Tax=Kamptonema formosum TaxID=331992 RepID=UPI0012DBECC9|nr:hypothetical protein [Oscillatoria sp. PCC 10802]
MTGPLEFSAPHRHSARSKRRYPPLANVLRLLEVAGCAGEFIRCTAHSAGEPAFM